MANFSFLRLFSYSRINSFQTRGLVCGTVKLCRENGVNRQVNSSSAFWDIEGSVEVKENDNKDIENKFSATVIRNKSVDGEVLRITNFGHVRLDSENVAREEQSENPVKENYIDSYFFGDYSVSSKSPEFEKPKSFDHKPTDLNVVDKQYFAEVKTEKDTKYITPTPKVEVTTDDLVFSDNEIDNQYFGKSKDPSTSQPIQNAFNYAKSLRAQKLNQEPSGMKFNKPAEPNIEEDAAQENQGSKMYSSLVPNWYKMSDDLITYHLKKSVLYNQGGIVAIDKPYGIATTDVDQKADFVLTKYLPKLSKLLKYEKLHTVHRLDRDTTGVLLMASTQEMAHRLHKLFQNHQIKKTYLAVTKGVPNPLEGTIDIPLYETNVSGRMRMKLRPVLPHNQPNSSHYNTKVKSHRAVTHFKVLRHEGSAALIRLEPETGVRHQLRVHLSEGLSCPVLGDHKYSHEDKYAPQKWPQDMLDRLRIRQSKVRKVPMHLHALSICIPKMESEESDLFIKAPLPFFYNYTIKRLKLPYKS